MYQEAIWVTPHKIVLAFESDLSANHHPITCPDAHKLLVSYSDFSHNGYPPLIDLPVSRSGLGSMHFGSFDWLGDCMAKRSGR